MFLQSLWRNLRIRIGPLRDDECGNVIVIFAIALVPIIGLIGAAVDYTRANSARSAMQAALDSTALMLAKDAATLTPDQLTSKANAYFTAMYNHPEAKDVAISAIYSASGPSGSTVQLNGSGSINTDFMKVVGFPQLPFSTSSTAAWGTTRLRVALVLDNTGSMASYGKIGALQTAAKNLVNQLSALAKTSNDVYISVIPFVEDVNVGTTNVNAAWLDWTYWDTHNASQNSHYCSDSNSDTQAMCRGHGYSWNKGSTTSHSSWNGCVSDRGGVNAPDPNNYDATSTPPSTGTPATLFPADQASYCPAATVLPLSNNWSTITNLINSMTANGGTNQPIGLHWGWLSLLQQAPLNAPAEDNNYRYQHIIILFTDGLNTWDRWYGNGYNTSTQVDTRMKLLCDNIKASGVTIYTIQIDTDGAGQSAVLPYCASDSSKFFMLTSSSQIVSAFQQIGTQISLLRLAK